MEFRIAKLEFLRGLKLAQGIADKKNVMPMLGNVVLRTHGKGQILVAATDLNVSLTAELKSANAVEGGIALDAKSLYELVANAPGEDVTLKKSDGNHAEIKSGKAKYKLLGMSDRDFPRVPIATEAKLVKVDPIVLRDLIDRTIFATSLDDAKFNLAGVLLESDGKVMRASATDGHRASVVERIAAGPVFDNGVLVPRKGLGEIRKIAESNEAPMVGVAGPILFVQVGTLTIAAKLIAAEFPNLRTMFDGIANKTLVTVDRLRLIESLKRVQLMTSETRGVKITTSADGLSLVSEHPDMGQVSDEIGAECSGPHLSIGFNPKYLVEILSTMTSEQAVIALGTDVDPALIMPFGDKSHRCVAMPMRL